MLPLLGGIAGGTATVYASSKLDMNPLGLAAAAAAGGLALTMIKAPWAKQLGAGAFVGAGTLGGITLTGKLLMPHKSAAPAKGPQKTSHRADSGTGFVTRAELQDALQKQAQSHNDALSKHAEAQSVEQKQQTCNILSALDTLRKALNEMQASGTETPSYLHAAVRGADERDATVEERDAEGERDYMRDAYGEEPRDAAFVQDYYTQRPLAFDYMRDAYGEERDAPAYEERDAEGERDAPAYDERDAPAFEERDAPAYEERDAEGERDAPAYEERDSDGERDAPAYEERDAEAE